MTGSQQPTEPYPAWATIRDRCRALGMPVWRSDSGGAIVDEPRDDGLAGLWLRSSTISQAVAAAAMSWRDVAEPGIIEPFTGCWLIPIPEQRRRRPLGNIIAMALSRQALQGPQFGQACRVSGLDELTARGTMTRMARFDREGAENCRGMLLWMAKDLTSLADHESAIDGFTTELTQSYETINLLYSLGRSMLDLENPDRYIEQACDRLHETMPFGWLAAKFIPDPGLTGSLANRFICRGRPPGAGSALDSAMLRLIGRLSPEDRGYLVPSSEPPFNDQPSRTLAHPIARDGKVVGILVCGGKEGGDPQISSYDIQLLEAASTFSGAFLENACLYQSQQSMLLGSLKALTAAIDAKDQYTCGHSERVALLGRKLALESGMAPAQAERVHVCGLLHDVGKIGVPEAVLCKPGRLTESEFASIKQHPEIGYRILKDIPMLEDVLPGVLHHHERWDGRGYPAGLREKDIPLVARILALADTFDAMSSTRSYRPAMPRQRVLEEIRTQAGTQFDPDLAHTFVGMDFSDYDAMVRRHMLELRPVAEAAPSLAA